MNYEHILKSHGFDHAGTRKTSSMVTHDYEHSKYPNHVISVQKKKSHEPSFHHVDLNKESGTETVGNLSGLSKHLNSIKLHEIVKDNKMTSIEQLIKAKLAQRLAEAKIQIAESLINEGSKVAVNQAKVQDARLKLQQMQTKANASKDPGKSQGKIAVQRQKLALANTELANVNEAAPMHNGLHTTLRKHGFSRRQSLNDKSATDVYDKNNHRVLVHKSGNWQHQDGMRSQGKPFGSGKFGSGKHELDSHLKTVFGKNLKTESHLSEVETNQIINDLTKIGKEKKKHEYAKSATRWIHDNWRDKM